MRIISYISFVNNSTGIAGISIYLSIPQTCSLTVNVSILPSLFHYYPKNLQLLTSPHKVKLYEPAFALQNKASGDYLIQSSEMLGKLICFTVI